MRNTAFDVLGFVLPLLVLLLTLAVVGAPAVGITVSQVHLGAAALAGSLAVAVLVRGASRGGKQ